MVAEGVWQHREQGNREVTGKVVYYFVYFLSLQGSDSGYLIIPGGRLFLSVHWQLLRRYSSVVISQSHAVPPIDTYTSRPSLHAG